jgi:hypothetical protein
MQFIEFGTDNSMIQGDGLGDFAMAGPLLNERTTLKVLGTKFFLVNDKPKVHFIMKLYLNGVRL